VRGLVAAARQQAVRQHPQAEERPLSGALQRGSETGPGRLNVRYERRSTGLTIHDGDRPPRWSPRRPLGRARALHGDFAARWLEQRDLRPRTRETYTSQMARILDEFEAIELSRISPSAVRALHSSLSQSGLHADTPSPSAQVADLGGWRGVRCSKQDPRDPRQHPGPLRSGWAPRDLEIKGSNTTVGPPRDQSGTPSRSLLPAVELGPPIESTSPVNHGGRGDRPTRRRAVDSGQERGPGPR